MHTEAFPETIDEIIQQSNAELGYGQQEEIQQSSRFRRTLGRTVAAGLATVGLLTGNSLSNSTTEEANAASPTCYGDYCSGLYADQTHCDEDAQTLTTESLKLNGAAGLDVGPVSLGGNEQEVGTLEIRYSQLCGTAWARLNTKVASPIQSLKIQQDTGYQQDRNVAGYSYPTEAVRAFTPMIYSRDHSYRASVYSHHPFNLPEEEGTLWSDFPQ